MTAHTAAITSQHIPGSQGSARSPRRTWIYRLLYLLWCLPVASFCAAPKYASYFAEVTFAVMGSMLLLLLKRRLATHILPFIALLSPLIYNTRVFGYGYADWYGVLLVALTMATIRIQPSRRLSHGDALLLGCFLLALASYLWSGHYRELSLGLFNLILVAVSYLRARWDIDTVDEMRQYFVTLLMSSALAGALITASFMNGINLNDFAIDDPVLYDYALESVVPKSSYFYANVFYVLGASLILAGALIALPGFSLNKIAFCFASLLVLLSLIMLFNKTAFVSLAAVVAFSVLALAVRRSYRNALLLIVLAVSVTAGIFAFSEVFPQINMILNLASVEARTGLIDALRAVYADSPLRLVLGFGPESALRLSQDIPIIAAAKTSTHAVEGTIDSAHLSFLFEYGLFFTLLYHVFALWLIAKLSACWRSASELRPIYAAAILVIVYVYVGALAQMIGVSKIGWVLAQIVALFSVMFQFQPRRN